MKFIQIKTIFNISVVVIMMIIFTGCSKDIFDGTNTSADDCFILNFESLNSTVTHRLELKKNDIIDVELTKNKGRIDVLVSEQTGNLLYRGQNISSGKFSLVITKNANYIFRITGNKASGYVSFMLRE